MTAYLALRTPVKYDRWISHISDSNG